MLAKSTVPGVKPLTSRLAIIAACAAFCLMSPGRYGSVWAQEGAVPPHWIWLPTGRPSAETPAQTCYFRKVFEVKEVSRLTVDATADDSFVLYLDGREVTRGSDWHTVKGVEVKLATGRHVLAAKASNQQPSPAGFLLRGGVLPLGQGVPIHTNSSWKVTDQAIQGDDWTKPDFDDLNWKRAADLGALGSGPWTGLVFESGDASERFKVPEGFKVSMVAAPSVTGSAISLNFDPQGRPCVGIEQGPIALLIDADQDGKYEDRKPITPTMKNCQGFAFVRGDLYAVGDGPQRTGIYRLKDGDGDGVFETTELIRATDGGMGEHGPHAIVLGPDGCLYYNNGNHAHLKPPIDPASPSNVAYEGELLPHYNDSRGHAVGIMAPCGEIYRSSDDGKTWERTTAGFRNQYDFAFNLDGEVFSFDSDMEWDIGLPWYRDVRVVHCPPGTELGSRNGSAVWPAYFYDSLPSTLDLGRGSPTGVTFYQASQFPEEYRDSFLILDWSQGRILAVGLTRAGASYSAKAKELVTGQPLNCTDIEVGPDGGVYFTTGGRGTQGGLFRVAYEGRPSPSAEKPVEPLRPRDRVIPALTIDSPLASFSQETLARIKKQAGEDWGRLLELWARDAKATTTRRTRALDLLTQFGPRPSDDLLIALAKDEDASVRGKAVFLLGMSRSEPARAALAGALTDRDSFVRRRACEALVRSHGPIPVEKVLPLLADPDRWIRYAARIAIEHAEPSRHRDQILAAQAPRPLLEGMLALVRATKLDLDTQNDLLRRQLALLGGSLAPDERLDLLRLIGLTYLLGPQKPNESPASADFSLLLIDALPGPVGPIRRETARLLAALAGAYSPKAVTAILKLQEAEPDHATQIHYAYCLRVLKEGWTTGEKRQIWAWFEAASHWDGGFSFLGYLDFMIQDMLGLFGRDQGKELIANGEKYPFPTRILVRSIDLNAAPDRIGELGALYARLDRSENAAMAAELRGVILDVIGRSRRPAAHTVLRALYKADPARRELIARSLAERPTAEDLPTLAAALDTRDANTASIVVAALRRLDASPEGPEALRNLIRLVRRTGPAMQSDLNELAARWTQVKAPPGDFAAALASWEKVYAQRFPNGPTLVERPAEGQNAYTLDQLVRDVLGPAVRKSASAERGKAVIARARCLDCHKFGDQGQALGPDLTTVSSRFRPAEILESIVEPSKVISDQYKSVSVATADGKLLNGMPAGGDADKLVLLLADSTRITIPKAEIEDQKNSKVSVMPDNLLNALTLQDIADLLALFDSAPRVEVPVDSKTGDQARGKSR